MKQNGTTNHVRTILRAAGEPVSIAQILEALPVAVERNNVSALLHQRKAAGEFKVQIIDGKPHYSLVPGYVKACPQRTPLAGQIASPPAPSSAPGSAPTGPAPVATPSPAPSRTPDAAPPHAAKAAAPEILPLPPIDMTAALSPSRADLARFLADDIENLARKMAADRTADSDDVAEMISCTAMANRLAGLLAAGGAA